MRARFLLYAAMGVFMAACAHRPSYETRIDGAVAPTSACVASTLTARGDLSVTPQGAATRYSFRTAAISGVVRVVPDRMIYQHRLSSDNRVRDLGEPTLETMNAVGRSIDEAISAAC